MVRPVEDYYRHIEANLDKSLDGLKKFLSQPTVSTQGVGVEETAELLVGIMEGIGIKCRKIKTPGSPVIYGEIGAEPSRPTILIYGHYDVQPPEPLSAWESQPFQPTIRNGRIYARGAGDNKGQLYAQLMGVKTHLEINGRVPINIKFIFEGEEENGSPNLPAFVAEHKDLLKSDLVYISDGPVHESGRPNVVLGVRGLLYVELRAKGANRDLHSGNWGGPIPNPMWRLVRLLQSMKDEEGRVLIDGFYERVRKPTSQEMEAIRAIPHDAKRIATQLGLSEEVPGVEEFFKKLMFEPTLNICGALSGYTGEGTKTVLPSEAMVKMDMRLVADQDPDEILKKFRSHVAKHDPGVEVLELGKMNVSRTPLANKFVPPIVESAREATGEEPVIFPSLGGSLPTSLFTDVLKEPCIIVPYANFDESNHAPNENIAIANFERGIKCCATVLQRLSEVRG